MSDKQRKRRIRRKFKFFLTISNELDRKLADKLSFLKSKESKGKSMTEYIRNGVLLYSSLKDDADLGVLFAMFPWIKEVVSPQIDAVVALQKQMNFFEQALIKTGHTDVPSSRSLVGSLVDDDDFDTEPLMLRVATNVDSEKGSGADNFLDAFMEVSH